MCIPTWPFGLHPPEPVWPGRWPQQFGPVPLHSSGSGPHRVAPQERAGQRMCWMTSGFLPGASALAPVGIPWSPDCGLVGRQDTPTPTQESWSCHRMEDFPRSPLPCLSHLSTQILLLHFNGRRSMRWISITLLAMHLMALGHATWKPSSWIRPHRQTQTRRRFYTWSLFFKGTPLSDRPGVWLRQPHNILWYLGCQYNIPKLIVCSAACHWANVITPASDSQNGCHCSLLPASSCFLLQMVSPRKNQFPRVWLYAGQGCLHRLHQHLLVLFSSYSIQSSHITQISVMSRGIELWWGEDEEGMVNKALVPSPLESPATQNPLFLAIGNGTWHLHEISDTAMVFHFSHRGNIQNVKVQVDHPTPVPHHVS